MSAPKLPALRLTAEGNCVIGEGVSLDLPPNNKFSVSYAPTGTRQSSSSSVGSTSSPSEAGTSTDAGLSVTGDQVEVSDDQQQAEVEENGEEHQATIYEEPSVSSLSSVPPPPVAGYSNGRMDSIPERPGLQMSRTLSMPLPSRLHHLQNPHRPGHLKYRSSPRVPLESSQVNEVSVELADSIQLVIQTMLQISPPQVLDPAKELFSACALSVPTSSMSAMFTAMKNINYISANMSAFCDNLEPGVGKSEGMGDQNEFDVGEVVQCLGDVLSGFAAQAGVDLVIYHGDATLKHAYVSGDESGVSFALSHIVRQILNTADRGDSIELGLFVGSISDPSSAPQSHPPKENDLAIHPLDSNGPIRVTIRISHKFAHQGQGHPDYSPKEERRPQPLFSTLILRRILRQIGGNIVTNLPPPDSFTSGRTCDVELILDRAAPPIPTPAEEEAPEPNLDTLVSFGETLKGKRVTLYASAKGSFAHHLTSYLTAWGMDVTHVSPDGQVDGTTEQAAHTSSNPQQDDRSEGQPETRAVAGESSSLIFIDDDVGILKERLQALRYESQPPISVLAPRKRPSLSANHRPRSSPQMARLFNSLKPPPPSIFLHFTSLANYKLVKDVMQSIATSYAATATPLPEVMIIPKPAGPRRFLTALHTAITKPTVDPFFMPIATSPMSPGGIMQLPGHTSVIASPTNEVSSQASIPGSTPGGQIIPQPLPSPMKGTNRPHSSRTNSDRSTKSLDAGPTIITSNLPPPSPLAIPDNVEYFSNAAAQKLGTSPSSGLVIQSPDGQTAGIYFQARSKNTRTASNQSVEMDGRSQLVAPRRQSTSRKLSNGKKDDMSFSALYGHSPSSSASPERKPTVSASASPTPHPVALASPSIQPSIPTPMPPPPVPEEPQAGPSSETIRPPIFTMPSDDTRKVANVPTPTTPDVPNTTTPSRKGGTRRPTDTTTPSSATKKGKANTDANVVPPISVLIVDDNPINQTILSTFMRRKKIKYDLASNGAEAVQKWKSGGFHLILMDIQMPIMDGISATKEIRRLEKSNAESGFPPLSPAMRTPSEVSLSAASSSTGETTDSKAPNSPYRSSVIIVALTASSLQSDRVAALAAGCNDFLTKPVSLLWLNNKIIEWGSIKALQMWADIRPEAVRSLAADQAQAARGIAERLQVPKPKLPSSARRTPSTMDDNAAALALASSAGPISLPGLSPTTSSFSIPDRPNSAASSSAPAGPSTQANGSTSDFEKQDASDNPPAGTPATNDSGHQVQNPLSDTQPLPNETDDASSCTSESTKTRESGSTENEDHVDDSNPEPQRSDPPVALNQLPP